MFITFSTTVETEDDYFQTTRVGGIAVAFMYEGKETHGILSGVKGAGGNMWHLHVDGFHRGQLFKGARGWRFSFQKEGYNDELSLQFGALVEHSPFY